MNRTGRIALVAVAFVLALGSGKAFAADSSGLRETLDRASGLFSGGDYAGAREAYRRATEMDPGSITAWRGLGWSLWELGDEGGAIAIWKDALKVVPDDRQTLLALGQAYEHRQEWDQAIAYYGKIVEHDPADYPARMGRARVFRELNRPDAAKRELRIAVENHPADFDAQFLLAQTYQSLGEADEAHDLFLRLARRREPEPKHYRALADVLLKMDRPKEAIDYYRRNLRRNPGNRGTILGLARAHAQLHDYQAAVDYLAQFLRNNPEDPKIREELARFAGYGGFYEAAEKHLRTLIERHPEETKWKVSLAVILGEAGAKEKSIELANDILRQDPDNVQAMELLIANTLMDDRPEDAIRHLRRLVQVDPRVGRLNQLGDLYITLGGRYGEEGRSEDAEKVYAKAVEVFRQAVERAPRNGDARLGVATALRLKGDYDEAVQAASEVYQEHPNVERARRELYESYSGMGRHDEALEFLESIMRTFPENPRHEEAYAKLLFKKGEPERAIRYIQERLEKPLEPSVPVLLYHGISEGSTREDTMPVANFRDQMRALKEAGYQSITIHQFTDFLRGEGDLPSKPILITFDDARTDSYRYADPVLRDVGYHAVMFVPVDEVGKHGPFTAVWSTLREKYETGRWDLQCHSFAAHRPIPVGPDGRTGAFLAHRMWLAEKDRLETHEEFARRLDEDYQRCAEALRKKIPDLELAGYAYPFGEIGQKALNNEPQAIAINKELATKYYGFGFVQDPGALVTRRSSPPVLPRFEVPWNYTGKQLLTKLRSIEPKTQMLLTLADLYAWDGQFADAERVFDHLERQPEVDQADLALRRGRILSWQGDFAKARSYLERAQAGQATDRDVRRSLRSLNLRTSPTLSGEGLVYDDNSGRTHTAVGPSGEIHLTDRWTLGANYRFRSFTDGDFRASDVPGGNQEQTNGSRPGESQEERAQAQERNVDLEAVGNEVEAVLGWRRDWRTGLQIAAGVASFSDESSEEMLRGPDPFPIGRALFDMGLGAATDLQLGVRRSYVDAAGAILDDLGSTQAEGRVETEPVERMIVRGRGLYSYYDDGNQRTTAVGHLLARLWEEPTVRTGYRFTLDDTQEENPFFYTPNQFIGNDGVVEIEYEPAEFLQLGAEASLGVGRERETDPELQASVLGRGRVQLAERFGLFVTGGRSQAARFDALQATGGFFLRF